MNLYELEPGDMAYLRVNNHSEHRTEYVPVKVDRVLKTQIVLEDGRRYQRDGGFYSGTRDNRYLHEQGLQVYNTRLVTEDDPGYLNSLHSDEWIEAKRSAVEACLNWRATVDRQSAGEAIAALTRWLEAETGAGPGPVLARAFENAETPETAEEN